jgi:hypothetical protein
MTLLEITVIRDEISCAQIREEKWDVLNKVNFICPSVNRCLIFFKGIKLFTRVYVLPNFVIILNPIYLNADFFLADAN